MCPEDDGSGVDLVQAVEGKLKDIQTRSLDLSFNELMDMNVAEDQELRIDPDFQRLFVWTEGQRSRFIESLLLELPIPPIFVLEEEDGKYSLIDGLQRFSSYLHFRGQLNADHLDPPVRRGDMLTLSECDIAPELNGKQFEDLPVALKIKLKRAFVRVEIIRKQSNPLLQYHMFKRLNTGGSQLTPQQVRNCTVRLISSEFIDFLGVLSRNEDFQACLEPLGTQKMYEFYDQELVLRFLALIGYRDKFRHDVGDFLTEYMEKVSSKAVPFDYSEREVTFCRTFAVLNRALGDKTFGTANAERTDLRSSFGVYQFESFSAGIQRILSGLDPEDGTQMKELGEQLKAIKLDSTFIELTTGGGKNSPGQLSRRIDYVAQKLTEFRTNAG